MIQWFRQLDRLLRGEATRVDALRGGTIQVPAGGLAVVAVLLGAIYGVCMGLFAVTGSGSGAPVQILAAALKVPALFFLTLLVTFPSLYVFNALVGSRLGMVSVLRLLVAAIGVMLTVLASLGPIVGFFALTTTSYPFMKVLNVMVFTLAGVLGGAFLLQTLHRLTVAMEPPRPGVPVPVAPVPVPPMEAGAQGGGEAGGVAPAGMASVEPGVSEVGRGGVPPVAVPPVWGARPPLTPGALEWMRERALSFRVKVVFTLWLFVFGLVGAQMAWLLRPFIGNPNQPFEWFRPKESNFFEALFRSLVNLVS